MRRKSMMAILNLFMAAVVLLGNSAITWSGEYCGNRPHFSGGGRGPIGGTRDIYRSGHGLGLFKKEPCTPGSQPKRFYDSTGRWTGDGVDSMSTAKPHNGYSTN